MGDIYERACLTIATTAAVNSEAGCFTRRPLSNTVRVPCSLEDSTEGIYSLSDASWIGKDQIDEAPLNKSAWTFQERILSRRIIHLAASQMDWTCRKATISQENVLPIGILEHTKDYH